MKLTKEQTDACAKAAYRGFAQNWRSGFDVVIDLDHPACRGEGRLGAGPIASGCRNDGDTLVWTNVAASDFGDSDPAKMSEAEFVSGYVECFGLIEIPDVDE